MRERLVAFQQETGNHLQSRGHARRGHQLPARTKDKQSYPGILVADEETSPQAARRALLHQLHPPAGQPHRRSVRGARPSGCPPDPLHRRHRPPPLPRRAHRRPADRQTPRATHRRELPAAVLHDHPHLQRLPGATATSPASTAPARTAARRTRSTRASSVTCDL